MVRAQLGVLSAACSARLNLKCATRSLSSKLVLNIIANVTECNSMPAAAKKRGKRTSTERERERERVRVRERGEGERGGERRE